MTTRPAAPQELLKHAADAVSRTNPRSRWHESNELSGQRRWACVPLTDAIYAIGETIRAARADERARHNAELRSAVEALGKTISTDADDPERIGGREEMRSAVLALLADPPS